MPFTPDQFQSVLRRNAQYLREAQTAHRTGRCRDAMRLYTDFARTTGALVAMELETPKLNEDERREVMRRVKSLETFQADLRRRCVRR